MPRLASYETTYRELRPAMRHIAKAIYHGLAAEDVKVDPYWEDNAQDFGFHVCAGEPGRECDAFVFLSDARDYEGEEAQGSGNVALTMHGTGGIIVGSFIPYNYTDDCWERFDIAGRAALRERLALIAGSASEAVAIIVNHLAEGN